MAAANSMKPKPTYYYGVEQWEFWPEVKLRLTQLPKDMKPIDLHRLFRKEGNIHMIDVKPGISDASAFIVFRYVQELWVHTNTIYCSLQSTIIKK
jgi:hypothetical protein